ncbi:hypothetical protein GGS20DRAFT_585031 [Poronia punctata]|nr:hypothetical protein GGS20DRAFT_585031 [Poronia punctata]
MSSSRQNPINPKNQRQSVMSHNKTNRIPDVEKKMRLLTLNSADEAEEEEPDNELLEKIYVVATMEDDARKAMGFENYKEFVKWYESFEVQPAYAEFIRDFLEKDENWKKEDPEEIEVRRVVWACSALLLGHRLFDHEPVKDDYTVEEHWGRFGFRVWAVVHSLGSRSLFGLIANNLEFSSRIYIMVRWMKHKWVLDHHPEDLHLG